MKFELVTRMYIHVSAEDFADLNFAIWKVRACTSET